MQWIQSLDSNSTPYQWTASRKFVLRPVGTQSTLGGQASKASTVLVFVRRSLTSTWFYRRVKRQSGEMLPYSILAFCAKQEWTHQRWSCFVWHCSFLWAQRELFYFSVSFPSFFTKLCKFLWFSCFQSTQLWCLTARRKKNGTLTFEYALVCLSKTPSASIVNHILVCFPEEIFSTKLWQLLSLCFAGGTPLSWIIHLMYPLSWQKTTVRHFFSISVVSFWSAKNLFSVAFNFPVDFQLWDILHPVLMVWPSQWRQTLVSSTGKIQSLCSWFHSNDCCHCERNSKWYLHPRVFQNFVCWKKER